MSTTIRVANKAIAINVEAQGVRYIGIATLDTGATVQATGYGLYSTLMALYAKLGNTLA